MQSTYLHSRTAEAQLEIVLERCEGPAARSELFHRDAGVHEL